MKDPQDYGLSQIAAAALHQIYVVEERSIRESVSRARHRTGETIKEKQAGYYIRDNGWTRTPQHYARKSTFSRQNQASFEEAKAKRDGRI